MARSTKRNDNDRENDKGYVKAERGKIKSWSKNMILEGRFMSFKESKFKDNPLMRFHNDETQKVETWSCPTVLRSFLEEMKEGTQVKILCHGKTIKSEQKGRSDAWDFDVSYVPF